MSETQFDLFSGYEPAVRTSSTDNETNDRLRDDQDSFPYVKSKDQEPENFDEAITCVEDLNIVDRQLCSLMYEGLLLGRQSIALFSDYSKLTIPSIKNRVAVERYFGMEALSESSVAVAKIYTKISAYITSVSSALKTFIPATAELQSRSIASLKRSASVYERYFSRNPDDLKNAIIDIGKGGSPSFDELKKRIGSTSALINTISVNNSKNAAAVFLQKFVVFAKGLAADPSSISDDSEFSTMVNSDAIFENLPNLQELFEAVGITFDGSEAADFKDPLRYNNSSLAELGYTATSMNDITQSVPTKEQLLGCMKIVDILDVLSKQFGSINMTSDIADDQFDKFKTLLETLPNILTLVVSIYRTSLVASRYYTTVAFDIVSAVTNNIR